MGNGSSLPLYAQPKFPKVINARFVDHKRMVSLLLDDQFLLSADSQASPPREIRDADLDTLIFKVQMPSPNQKKLILVDSNGVAAVALECFTVESKLAIYEATNPLSSLAKQTNASPQVLARLETNFRPMEARIIVDLPDASGGTTRVQFRGRWEDRDAWLFIDNATFKKKTVDVEYLARIEPVKITSEEKKARKARGLNRKPYKVTIAPGVDVAFVTLVCAALDLEMAKKDVIFYPTEEDTARLAERPPHGALQNRAVMDVMISGGRWPQTAEETK